MTWADYYGEIMIYLNGLAFAMLVYAFGLAYLVTWAFNLPGNGLKMVIAGPLLTLADVLYRWKHPTGHWFKSEGGGNLFLIPVWIFGIFWTVLGSIYLIWGEHVFAQRPVL